MTDCDEAVRRDSSFWALLEAIGLSVFAFAVCIYCGMRGFFALDQSIVWDGAYRIFRGQRLFVDFFTPNGSAILLLQALVFKLTGPNFLSLLVTGALLNVVASLLTLAMLRQLFPAQRYLALAAGLISALWVFPPVGTPYPEPVAFTLCLAAIYCCIEAGPRGALPILSGVWIVVAFFTKPSIALLMAPLCVFLLSTGRLACGERIVQYFVGLLLGAAGALLWLIFSSDIPGFLTWTFSLPFETAIRRIPFLSQFSVLSMLSMSVVLLLALVWAWRKLSARLTRELKFDINDSQALLIAVYLLLVSVLFKRSMFNSPILSDALIGLLLALFAALNIKYCAARLAARRRAIWTLLFLVILAFGAFVSVSRIVHEPLYGAAFNGSINDPALWPLRWAEPTVIVDGDDKNSSVQVHASDVLMLIKKLRADATPFFVFPDSTFLYALSNAQPPQPLLWFHKGLTYPASYSQALDQRIVDALNANSVQRVVIESVSLFGTQARFNDFPLLRTWLQTEFKRSENIGVFEIWDRLPRP